MSTSTERTRARRERLKSLHPPLEYLRGISAEGSKALGLESIGWLAETEPRRAAYYRGIRARAARLPATWWLERSHWTIAALVTAVEEASPLLGATLGTA